MSRYVLIKVKKNGKKLHKWQIFRIFTHTGKHPATIIQPPKIPKDMFQIRTYGKAELALLYQPCSSPATAQKTLYRWIKGCPLLLAELTSMHYNPKRRTFLKSEVEAIVRHLGEP